MVIQDVIKPIVILMAEDDEDDRLLAQDALTESRLTNDFYFVEDGVELINYLKRVGKYEDTSSYPLPDLILLDLNMPRKDGREALEEIKNDPDLKRIPIIILTTSKGEEDILQSYNLGVGGFITKPVTFDGLVNVMKVIGDYWVQIVKLPSKKKE
jgi:CheY-like chemotaxis protein